MATLGEFIPTSNTKLLLHLNGNSNDSSGLGNNGIDTAITYSLANGKFGQGAGLNGSTSKIVVTDATSLKPANLTISCWFNLSSNISGASQVAAIVSREGNVQGYVLNLLSPAYGGYTNNLEFYCANGTTGYPADLNANTITTGVWYNAIGTFDGSYVRLYLNGSLVRTSSLFSGSISYTTTHPLIVGTNSDYTNRPFPGAIDEVILENVAWSAEKVKKYYTYSKGRFGII